MFFMFFFKIFGFLMASNPTFLTQLSDQNAFFFRRSLEIVNLMTPQNLKKIPRVKHVSNNENVGAEEEKKELKNELHSSLPDWEF